MVERAYAVSKHGFEFFDIVDLCYYDDRLIQCDLVFLSKNVIKRKDIKIVDGKFDISKYNFLWIDCGVNRLTGGMPCVPPILRCVQKSSRVAR